ncbi:MAG: SurA N-terminal domain-containing protein [Muribaculaceae bacterium]|nr:SurA N-terminal domain-containing protein [Muribaculaceae bacterium]
MATLEKIRQRKKILAIVIGAALLAFIIEVGVEALGRQASNSTAVKVGSEKIDIMTFQKRVEQEAAQDQNQNRQIDAAVRQQQVLEEMINETLLKQEYDKVGIYVSDNEISELMIGKNPAPAVAQFAQQVGAESPAQLYDLLMNPSKMGAQESQVLELRQQWNKLKEDLVKQLKFSKLQTLLAGAIQANDLDRAQMAEDEALTTSINFVKKDFASLADDKYPVTDAELKAEWNKLKPMFRLDEETRRVHYIAVNIVPSPADIEAANKVADEAWAALQKGTGIDSVRILGKVNIDTAKTSLDKLTGAVKEFASSAAIGATKRDEPVNNRHKMYKLMNKSVSIDSINISMVVVPGNKKTQDSALALLNGGKTAEEVAKAIKGAQAQEDLWQQIASAPDSIKAKIEAAGSNYFVLNSSDQGAQLLKVNEKKAPKTFYTVATITYEAYASTKTSDDLRNKFQDFLNKNKTVADFEKNAAQAGYNAAEAMITPSTPQLGMNPYTRQGIKDSRKAIKWAFDSKKGQVSPIFSDNNDVLLAVAVDDIYDSEYIGADVPEIKEMLTARVRNSKKGDDLMKQFNGKAKDLAGYASIMGAQVDTTQVVFAQDMIAKIEGESGLVGRVAVAKPGALVGPWKGENGIYVFQVTKQDKAQRVPTKEELDNRYAQSRGASLVANPSAIYGILSRATNVKKSLINFY